MDVYFLILCAGFGGLLLMSLIGLGHQASSNHAHGHGAGHGHGHSHGPGVCKGAQPSHSQSHHGHGQSGGLKTAKSGHASGKGGRAAGFLFTLISPRVIFSLLLGFGAGGVLLRPLAAHWPAVLLPAMALICALGFEWYVVQPLWRLLFAFASNPAKTLDSLVLEEGKAVTNFDASGHGLIAVDLDGQVRQLLAGLSLEERTGGGRIRAGDRLFIRAVDAQRNSCTVSRLN